MDGVEAVFTRRSVRKCVNEPVSEESAAQQVNAILEIDVTDCDLCRLLE